MKDEQTGLLSLLEKLDEQGADDAEKTYRMREYLQAVAREESIPLHGTFELTPLCNLNCKMCYVHLSEQQLKQTGKCLLTTEQWTHIMGQAADAGMITATLTGGEALTYPGFDELYLYLLNRGISVTLKSNGLLMTEERVAFLKQHPVEAIQITLYGADNDTYEKVTGVRGFDAALAGIQRVKAAGIPLEVCLTPTKPALADMEKLLTLVNSLDVPVGISSGLYPAREETGRDVMALQPSLDDYVNLYKARAKLNHRELVPLREDDLPPLGGGGHEPVHGLPCGGGRSSFAIHWNGRMYPCLSFDTISADALHGDFQEGWKEIHQAVAAYPFPGECKGCAYQGICTPCVLSHELGDRPGHPNEFFCKRSQRLLAEGLAIRIDNHQGGRDNEESLSKALC